MMRITSLVLLLVVILVVQAQEEEDTGFSKMIAKGKKMIADFKEKMCDKINMIGDKVDAMITCAGEENKSFVEGLTLGCMKDKCPAGSEASDTQMKEILECNLNNVKMLYENGKKLSMTKEDAMAIAKKCQEKLGAEKA